MIGPYIKAVKEAEAEHLKDCGQCQAAIRNHLKWIEIAGRVRR